jgi:hypothetical protein
MNAPGGWIEDSTHCRLAGPTALGLTTTLLSLKLTPPQIRKRLLLFSLSAPTGAILTYMIVYMFGGGRHKAADGEFDRLGWSTAVTLLFSVSSCGAGRRESRVLMIPSHNPGRIIPLRCHCRPTVVGSRLAHNPRARTYP